MNREILFRGKRLDNGEWVEGFVIRVSDGVIIKEGEARKAEKRTAWGSCDKVDVFYSEEYYVIPETVGQYTGLKDKSGIKIFEGDIVNVGRYAGTVEFSIDDVWSCRCCNDDFDGSGFIGKDTYGDLMRLSECEVIGNRFDNPELVQGELETLLQE